MHQVQHRALIRLFGKEALLQNSNRAGREASANILSSAKAHRMTPIIKLACSLLIGAHLLMICEVAHSEDAPRRILFFSKSSGYEDPMIHRISGQSSPAERILTEMGKENRLEFTFTKDGSGFTPDNLSKYDAFCFFTSGDLLQAGDDHTPPMTKDGKAAFLNAIRDGKGFIGIRSAADTFHSPGPNPDPYLEMIGGEFLSHNAPATARLIVADKTFPGMSALPDDFRLKEDWYVMNNFSTNLHVLLVQDTSSMGRVAYNVRNYPSTWAHRYGSGRVFYTSMGHSEEVWNNPAFRQILAGGFKWAVGLVTADVTPNLEKATPQAGRR
jgi:type 1 glutamine amidotransferase